MRQKGSLVLMEQLIMVLVFALAAALCLQAFVLADRISADNAARDRAMLKAQSVAEEIKSCHGDGVRAAELLGGIWEAAPEGASYGGNWHISYDDQWAVTDGDAVYTAVATATSQKPYLGKAIVLVYDRDGGVLADLTVQWQTEVSGNEG